MSKKRSIFEILQSGEFGNAAKRPALLNVEEQEAGALSPDLLADDNVEDGDSNLPQDSEVVSKLRALLEEKNYDEIIATLRNLPDAEAQQSIHFADADEAYQEILFKSAAEAGRLDLVELLIELTPDSADLTSMLHSNGDGAFYAAAKRGDFDLIKRLLELTQDDDKLKAMVYQHSLSAINEAAEQGHTDLLEFYFELALNRNHEELSLKDDENDILFLYAVLSGSLKTAQLVEKYKLAASGQAGLEAMLHASRYSCFLNAAAKGFIEMMEHLYTSTVDPVLQNTMILAQDDAPFMQAAKYGHIEAMKYILQRTPDLQAKYDMIHSQNDAPIAAALAHQQKESVAFLINEAEIIATDLGLNAADIKSKMFHAMDDGAFKIAILRDMEGEYKQIVYMAQLRLPATRGLLKKFRRKL